MERRIRSKEELMENKDEILEAYYSRQPRSRKAVMLSKKEKKALGIGRDIGKATIKYARIPASKAKLVIDLIRNKPLDEAYAILRYTPRRASRILYKLVKSAEANAVNNFELDRDLLYVADAYANQGPGPMPGYKWKLMPKARGRADRIRKRTSHITVVLKERNQE